MNIKKDKRGLAWLTAGGKRCRVLIMTGPWIEGVDPSTIKVLPKGGYFPQEICEVLSVTNNSDMTTDYFEKDKIVLTDTHILHQQAKEAA